MRPPKFRIPIYFSSLDEALIYAELDPGANPSEPRQSVGEWVVWVDDRLRMEEFDRRRDLLGRIKEINQP